MNMLSLYPTKDIKGKWRTGTCENVPLVAVLGFSPIVQVVHEKRHAALLSLMPCLAIPALPVLVRQWIAS